MDVDLSDNEGNVKHLWEAPLRYANEVLKERETLVLVRVESKLSLEIGLGHTKEITLGKLGL